MSKTVSGVLGVRLGEGEGPDGEPGQGQPVAEQPVAEQPVAEQPVAEQPAAEQPAAEHAAQPVVEPPAPSPAHPAAAGSGPEAEPDDQPAEPEDQPVEVPREPDAVLAGAVELAREAAREVGGSAVGAHLDAQADGPVDGGPVATHSFASTDPAYVGWRWAVTVARADGSEHVTVDEVVLLPGEGALLAPAWVPWSERVQAGDIGPGDLLPPPADDERLVPAYAAPDGPDAALAEATFFELGLGRPRVLSLEGRLEAAQRWWDGEPGPGSALARQAPGTCSGCGFLVPLGGALRAAFGVCANEVAPDDGRVVALAHGCGAHSETVVDAPHAASAGMAVEDDEFELVPSES